MLDKNIVPETIPFDFDENYQAIKDKFFEYGYDLQEGSNTMQLATAMSYLVSMLNANTAVNINEMLLPLARKRKMVLQDARLLGYETRHVMSYKYDLTLDFPEGLHKIDRYEKFTSGGKNYYYMGDNIVSFEGPKSIKLTVSEGDLKEWRTDPSLISNLSVSTSSESNPVKDYFVDIPYTKVAENGLRVFATYIEPSGVAHDLKEYFRLDSFLIDADVKGTPGYVRLDNLDFGTPRIYFKLGDVGIDLPENTRVFIDALISSGLDGEMKSTNPSDIKTDLNCEVTAVKLVNNGAQEECIESIRRNATLFHNSANRLVTKEDYRGFVNRDTKVKSSVVWDGGDEYPYRPGNIWYSALPRHTDRLLIPNDNKTKWVLDNVESDNRFLTLEDIQNLESLMEPAKVPTMTLLHRNPVYLSFDYKIQVVRYSRPLTTSEWNERAFDVINKYFLSTDTVLGVETYSYEYFQSSLVKRIDTVLTDITGFNIELSNYIMLTKENLLNEDLNACTSPNDVISRLDNNKNQLRFHLGTPFEKYINESPEGEITVLTEYLPKIDCLVCRTEGKYLEVDFDNPEVLGKRVVQYKITLGDGLGANDYVGEYRVFLDAGDTIEVVLFSTPRDMSPMDPLATEAEHKIWDKLQSGLRVNLKYSSPNFRVTRNTIPSLGSVEFINR